MYVLAVLIECRISEGAVTMHIRGDRFQHTRPPHNAAASGGISLRWLPRRAGSAQNTDMLNNCTVGEPLGPSRHLGWEAEFPYSERIGVPRVWGLGGLVKRLTAGGKTPSILLL